MEQREETELEYTLRRTIEKQGQLIASLTNDLYLAQSQAEYLKKQELNKLKQDADK